MRHHDSWQSTSMLGKSYSTSIEELWNCMRITQLDCCGLPITYSFLCSGREAGSVHTRAILWPMDPGDDGRFGRCSCCVRFVLPFVHIITIQLASQTAKPVFVPFSPWVWNHLYLNWALILYRIHFTLHTVIYLCFSSLHCFFPNVFTSYHLAVIENEAFFIWLSIMNNLYFK